MFFSFIGIPAKMAGCRAGNKEKGGEEKAIGTSAMFKAALPQPLTLTLGRGPPALQRGRAFRLLPLASPGPAPQGALVHDEGRPDREGCRTHTLQHG